ncbi:PIN domain-containing protein [Candidatus Gottesmanbacteria bacterium]|nr:PIN domain-containing protein [Candidatus Gottesmanbacteria bacterium]
MSNIQRVIIDTSILIDHLRGTSEDFKLLDNLRIQGKIELLIPDIVICELFAGKEARKKKVQENFNKLIEDLSVTGLTINSAKIAGKLIRTYTQIPDPFDFLIAAVAIEQNAYIATHNIKHFKQIPQIKLLKIS